MKKLTTPFLIGALFFGISNNVNAFQQPNGNNKNLENYLESDPISEILELKSKGSLPIWEKPSKEEFKNLTDAVYSLNDGIFILGNSKGGYGTAFVISKEHELLATNAHVADIGYMSGEELLAIRNDSTEVYNVDQIYYHPGLMRKLGGSLPVRSRDPKDGEVIERSADVAVVKLKKANLSHEFKIATKDELDKLFAQSVGMLGYPGHDTINWPAIGEKPKSTFRAGVISRLTDFYGNANANKEELQHVQHTMSNWFGFSGSPIFLSNGHVVAINNSTRSISKGNLSTTLSYGIRIDTLWELLAFHGLEKKVAIDSKPQLVDRFKKIDKKEIDYRKAVDLVTKARLKRNSGELYEGATLLNEAIKLAPKYYMAYLTRSNIYNIYANSSGVSNRDKIQYAKWGLADAKKAVELEPSDPWTMIFYSYAHSVLSKIQGNEEDREARLILTNLLNSNVLNKSQTSEALKYRAGTWNYSDERMLTDLNNSIELEPFNTGSFIGRSHYWNFNGRPDLAAIDIKRCDELETALKNSAKAEELIFLKSQNFQFKESIKEGLELALKACETTHYKYYPSLYSSGVAYFYLGNLDDAIMYFSKALEYAPDEQKGLCKRSLKYAIDHRILKKYKDSRNLKK